MIVCETESIIIYHTITLHVQPATLGPYGGNMRHKNKEREKIQKECEHKSCACKCYRLQSNVIILMYLHFDQCTRLIIFMKKGDIFS